MDREFVSIVNDIEEYTAQLGSQELAPLLARKIDTQALARYLDLVLDNNYLNIKRVRDPIVEKHVLEEMEAFGLGTIGDIHKYVTTTFLNTFRDNLGPLNTDIGFSRYVMMYADINRYFEIWNRHWVAIDRYTKAFLEARYGPEKTASLIAEHDLLEAKDDEFISEKPVS